MTRTPYVTGRPRRALAALAAALGLLAGLTGCNLNPSPGAPAATTVAPTDAVTPTATAAPTATRPTPT
ncbi:MAG: hypothetical protein IRY85_12655, partial [Micromonosporaceae bacterium]|nr:hypothetical protein [Micromonosporaceae bacterium]